MILFVPGSEVGDLEAIVRRATRREEGRGGAGPGENEMANDRACLGDSRRKGLARVTQLVTKPRPELP